MRKFASTLWFHSEKNELATLLETTHTSVAFYGAKGENMAIGLTPREMKKRGYVLIGNY